MGAVADLQKALEEMQKEKDAEIQNNVERSQKLQANAPNVLYDHPTSPRGNLHLMF